MAKLTDILKEKKNKGLWANIHAKRKRGEKPAKKGDKDYPKTLDIEGKIKGVDGKACWDGYRYAGTKNGKDKCVKIKEGGELVRESEMECFMEYLTAMHKATNEGPILEAEYEGRKVKLNKPMAGDVGKFKVYVASGKKNADGSMGVKKVNFGQKGARIKKDNPEARASFRARHKCDQKKDKTSAGYWSCKKW